MRWRQRVSDERSNTNACWKNSSPQKYRKYGLSTQRSHRTSSESVLEDRQPRHQPRRQRRLARLVGVHRPERLLQKTPIDRPRQLHNAWFMSMI
jgi:hypothetical protein